MIRAGVNIVARAERWDWPMAPSALMPVINEGPGVQGCCRGFGVLQPYIRSMQDIKHFARQAAADFIVNPGVNNAPLAQY